MAFGEQLSRSHTKAIAQAELCLLDLALHASKDLEKFAAASSEKLAVPGTPRNLLGSEVLGWSKLPAAMTLLRRR